MNDACSQASSIQLAMCAQKGRVLERVASKRGTLVKQVRQMTSSSNQCQNVQLVKLNTIHLKRYA